MRAAAERATGEHAGAQPTGWRARVLAASRALHRIVGAPDYEGYVAHHARCHPGAPALSREEFVRQRQEDRYSRPGARCC